MVNMPTSNILLLTLSLDLRQKFPSVFRPDQVSEWTVNTSHCKKKWPSDSINGVYTAYFAQSSDDKYVQWLQKQLMSDRDDPPWSGMLPYCYHRVSFAYSSLKTDALPNITSCCWWKKQSISSNIPYAVPFSHYYLHLCPDSEDEDAKRWMLNVVDVWRPGPMPRPGHEFSVLYDATVSRGELMWPQTEDFPDLTHSQSIDKEMASSLIGIDEEINKLQRFADGAKDRIKNLENALFAVSMNECRQKIENEELKEQVSLIECKRNYDRTLHQNEVKSIRNESERTRAIQELENEKCKKMLRLLSFSMSNDSDGASMVNACRSQHHRASEVRAAEMHGIHREAIYIVIGSGVLAVFVIICVAVFVCLYRRRHSTKDEDDVNEHKEDSKLHKISSLRDGSRIAKEQLDVEVSSIRKDARFGFNPAEIAIGRNTIIQPIKHWKSNKMSRKSPSTTESRGHSSASELFGVMFEVEGAQSPKTGGEHPATDKSTF